MEKKVLTPEELSKLQELDNKRGQLVEQFGIIEINIQDLELQKEKLIEDLSKPIYFIDLLSSERAFLI